MDTSEGKKLSELRVVDLKQELEKRKLEICGVKSTLLERLQKAIVAEGHDPDEFLFGVDEKLVSPSKAKVEEKVELKDSEMASPDPDMTDLVVKDDTEDQEEAVTQEGRVPEQTPVKSETETTPVIAADAGENNNMDNEDSLNLTIGEDEANLLQGEENDDKEMHATESVPKIPEDGKEVKTDTTEGVASLSDPVSKAEESDKKTAPKNGTGPIKDEKESSVKTSASSGSQKSAAAGTESGAGGATASSPSAAAGDVGKGVSGRNLWVSGLSSSTRATDLKQLFSKYGKVVGAKVVTNTKMPGSRCYGYVTMHAAEDALKCVEHLHRTELHGRMISVEKAKTELSAPKSGASMTTSGNTASGTTSSAATTTTAAVAVSSNKPGAPVKKPESVKKPLVSVKGKDSPSQASGDRNRSTSRRAETSRNDGDARDNNGRRVDRSKSSGTTARDEVSKALAAKERELQRERERDRLERQRERERFEADRLRHARETARLKEKLEEEEKRTREARRRAREEEERLASERKKIQLERARLEREKAELARLERQKLVELEREKLDLERQEIKRQQMKVEEAKRNLKRPAESTRDSGANSSRYDAERERKRSNNDRQFGGSAPPPPRFESSIRMSGSSGDKKRDDFPIKRDNSGYGGSSRSRNDDFVAPSAVKRADDYDVRSNKRDDYDSPKRGDDYGPSKRDRRDHGEYKPRDSGYNKRADLNEMPPRHSSSSGANYNPIPSHGRGGGGGVGVDNEMIVIQKPYIDHGPSRGGGGSSEFRRNMSTSNNLNNVTLIGGNPNNGGGGGGSGMQAMIMKDDRPRYVDNVSQNDLRYSGGGSDRGMSAPWGNNPGQMSVSKPFGNSVQPQSDTWKADDWRSLESGQDRYDRTYNERKSPYMEPSRPSTGSGGGGGGSYLNRPQDRYNSMSSSRFDSGRF